MHSFARRLHSRSSEASVQETKGLILNGGWRYDLGTWFIDTFSFRGQMRQFRQRIITLAHLQPGEQALDVGCGTGTIATSVARPVGTTGRVAGIDPSHAQIARARAKAARRRLSIEFQIGVIEQLPFPDQTFDVVFSTLMMHHLPAPLKRQGLAEIARVLKPEGRLVLADFTHKADRDGRTAHVHAGGSRVQDLVALVTDAGLTVVETEDIPSLRFSAFPGASIIRASRNDLGRESAQFL
jgi:ubiquinone/menaquinone biosynthesis C-methylase UbiE